jgi:hypothetical protein
MEESLVEAVLRRQLEDRQRQVRRGERGVVLPTEARRCPSCGRQTRQDNPGLCQVCRPPRLCSCGCERELDRRNTYGVAAACFLTIVAAFRDAPEPVRRQLRKLMPCEDGPDRAP